MTKMKIAMKTKMMMMTMKIMTMMMEKKNIHNAEMDWTGIYKRGGILLNDFFANG